jgi:hypothetical protein
MPRHNPPTRWRAYWGAILQFAVCTLAIVWNFVWKGGIIWSTVPCPVLWPIFSKMMLIVANKWEMIAVFASLVEQWSQCHRDSELCTVLSSLDELGQVLILAEAYTSQTWIQHSNLVHYHGMLTPKFSILCWGFGLSWPVLWHLRLPTNWRHPYKRFLINLSRVWCKKNMRTCNGSMTLYEFWTFEAGIRKGTACGKKKDLNIFIRGIIIFNKGTSLASFPSQ